MAMGNSNNDFELQSLTVSNQDIEEAFIDFLHEHYTPEQIHNINETFSYDPKKRTMTWRDGDDVVQIKGDKDGRLKEFRATNVEQTADNTQVHQLSMKNYGQEIRMESETRDADARKQRLKYILKTDGENYTEVMKRITTDSRTMQIPYIGLSYTERYRNTESSRAILKDNNYTTKGRTTTSYSGPLGAGIDTKGYSYKINSDGTTRNRNFSAGAHVDDVLGINSGAYYNSSTTTNDGAHITQTNRQFGVNTSVGLENGADVNLQYSRTVTDSAGNQKAHLGVGAKAGYYMGPLYSSSEASIDLESGQQHLSAGAGVNSDILMGDGMHASLDAGNTDTFLKFNKSARSGSLVGSKDAFNLSAKASSLSLDVNSNNSATLLRERGSQSINLQAGSAKAGFSQDYYGNIIGNTQTGTNAYLSANNTGAEFTNSNESNFITSNSATTLNLTNGENSTQMYYKSDMLTGNHEVGRDIRRESVNDDGTVVENSSSAHASIGTGGSVGVNYGGAFEVQNSVRTYDEEQTVIEGSQNRRTLSFKPFPDLDNNTHYIKGGIGYKENDIQISLNEGTGQYNIETENTLLGIATAGRFERQQISSTIHRDTLRAKQQMETPQIQTKLDQYLELYKQSSSNIEGKVNNFQTRPQRMLSSYLRTQHMEKLDR